MLYISLIYYKCSEGGYKDTELSKWFLTVVGVMQGCVLSPVLVDILLEVVITLALEKKKLVQPFQV